MPSLNFKSSRGFGVIEIVVAVVIIGMLAGGAYIYFQNQSNTNDSGLTSQEQKELAAACRVEIDDELLCKVFTNWGNLSSEPYTTTTTSSGADGETSMVYKVDGDDYHSIMNYDGQTMESMSVNGTSYFKMNGVWYRQEVTESDEPMVDEIEEDPTEEVNDVFDEEQASKTEYKRLGTESCDGVACVKYEIYTTDEPDNKMHVWVDQDKARVMRFQTVDDEGATMDMVYKYGAVSIVAPADAKDMSEMLGF